jgi:predicted ester cyclase
MEQIKKNKEFIVEYFNALSGVIKSPELIRRYVTCEELIEHILFFESTFPRYELFIDEMVAEGNKVVLRGLFKGKHEGDFNGIPPTGKAVEFPLAIGYEIANQKIIKYWLIADQLSLMEQLGIVAVPF